MIKLTAFCTLLFLFYNLNAQVSESYFSDQEQKEGGKIYDHVKYKSSIIVAGSSFDQTKYKAAIMRVDTSGTVLWNTAITDTPNYTGYAGKLLLAADGFVYAACNIGSSNVELWKVNPDSGQIIWKKSFNYILGAYMPTFMIDYDSSKIMVSYYSNYNGSVYDAKFTFIGKANGDSLATYFIGGMPWQYFRYAIAIDNNKDIYYSKLDSIYKVNGSNPKSFIWKRQHSSTNVADYHFIYYDTTTASVFFLGKRLSGMESGKILKINPSNGNLIADYTASTNEVAYSDMKVANGYLYVAWRHIYVGGGFYPFYVTKYKMATAAADWSIYYSFTGVGFSGGASGAMSLDLDSIGNIYATGYYASSNYGPGNWGVLKLNGVNGNSIYERTITEDSARNSLSFGLAACVFNNTPCFVGELETHQSANRRSHLTFVKLNANTGMYGVKKYLEGYYQFPSSTLFIEKYPSSQTVVLKQTGRTVELEMYDQAKKLLWKKVLSKDYFLFGANLSIAPNGVIYVSAYNRKESNSFPYYADNTDSIFLFELNSAGSMIKQYSFYVGTYKSFPFELYSDLAGALIFYQKNNIIYYRQVYLSSLSNEFNSQLAFVNLVSRTKYCYNKNTSKAFLFGEVSGITRLLELSRSTMGITNLAIIPPQLKKINYILETDNDIVVLCGKNLLNYESMCLYNTALKDTIWTKKLSNDSNSQILKCVTDPQKDYIYSIGQSKNNIVIRKNAIANGQQIWVYTYNGVSNLDDAPTDISYDPFRNQLLVSGYETKGSNKQAIILVIDSTGQPIDTILKNGEFKGDNGSSCTQVLYDHSQWCGGNLNKHAYGRAGFIFELADTTILPIVRVEHAAVSIKESGGSVTIKLKIANVNGKASSVNIANSGTATINADFFAPGSVVTFPATAVDGDSILVTYAIVDDTLIESNETVIAGFGAGNNAVVSGASKTITITDDDAPAIVTVDTSVVSVFEHSSTVSLKFKITNVNGKAATIQVNYTGTATSINDYFSPVSAITFPSSSSDGDSIIVTYTIIDDTISEGTETMVLGFSAGTNAVVAGSNKTILIIDNDTPVTIKVDTSAVQYFEGGGIFQLKFRISNINGLASSANLTHTGSALITGDYTVSATVVNFPATASNGDSIIVNYNIIDDNISEGNETIAVGISAGNNAIVSGTSKTITIIDNEIPVNITIDTSYVQALENSGSVYVVLLISNVNGLASSVNIVNTGTATALGDYTPPSSIITFPASAKNGDFIIVGYDFIDDIVPESNETIIANFFASNNAAVIGNVKTITILDDDAPAEITIDTTSIQVAENAGALKVKMKISNVNGRAASVKIANTGSATAAVDYTAPFAVAAFPASAKNGDSIEVTYTIINDAIGESNETIIAGFSAGSNASVTGAYKTITIIDNDTPATITIDTSTLQIFESAGAVKVKLKISKVNGQPTSINLANSGTATVAVDYLPPASTFTFPASAKNGDSVMVTFIINDDAIKENIENIVVDFTPGNNAKLNGNSKTIIIVDDDAPVNLTLDTATINVSENIGIVRIKVEINNVNGRPVTAALNNTGTAVPGNDYTLSTNSIAFPATAKNGDSVIISYTIKDDAIYEPAIESILTTYYTLFNCVFTNGNAQTILIHDNDPSGITFKDDGLNVSVYPNPCSKEVSWKIYNFSLSQISLFDATGKRCWHTSFYDTVSLNTVFLSSGIYFFEIVDESGIVKKGKLVKE